MTQLRIWGRITSINVRKVVWTAQELGLTFTRVDAGGQFGGLGDVEYVQRNPNRLIPTLEDGDFVLWESNVIVRYLCAKYGRGTLYPEDIEARFSAERWMDWQQTTLNRAAREAFIQLIRTPEGERDHDAIVRSVAATEPLLTLLDERLRDRPFLCGDEFGMADIPIACDVHRYWWLPRTHAPHSHLARWYAAIAARPATQGVFDIPLG